MEELDGVHGVLVLHGVVDAQVLHVQVALLEDLARRRIAVQELLGCDFVEHGGRREGQDSFVHELVELPGADAHDEVAGVLQARIGGVLDLLQRAVRQLHVAFGRVGRVRKMQHWIGQLEHVANHVLDALTHAVRVHLLEQ